MCAGYLNLHGTQRLVVDLGFCLAKLVEGSNLYKVLAVFADEHIAHSDVVFRVTSDDLDFVYR